MVAAKALDEFLAVQRLLEEAQATLAASSSLPPQKFRLHRGFLEEVIDNPKHPARPALIWRNGFYGVKPRTRIRVQRLLQASNAPCIFIRTCSMNY